MSSVCVGQRSNTYEITVDARRLMHYAASVNDQNPWYFDDVRPEGIVAPPMAAVALTWPLSRDAAAYWGTTGFPVAVLERKVLFTECVRWFRPIRPGDHLSIQGEVKAVLPHRAGTHLIIGYDARDAQGNLVFSEYAGALLRDVTCTDGARQAADVPGLPEFTTKAAPLWDAPWQVDPLAAHVYDACSDMFFPIHTSAAFAQEVGLPGILYQGTATLSVAVKVITDREAGGDPRRLDRVTCNFVRMITPGSAITVRALGKESLDEGELIHFTVLNEQGKATLRNASLLIRNQ